MDRRIGECLLQNISEVNALVRPELLTAAVIPATPPPLYLVSYKQTELEEWITYRIATVVFLQVPS